MSVQFSTRQTLQTVQYYAIVVLAKTKSYLQKNELLIRDYMIEIANRYFIVHFY